ncbi:uncharacterized protein LOC117121976 isoform X2 [Anneissia japonica]|uniref:uncharacterized protein LOC117121976 isoform X2 n=1 Tax=Anneissia japonica TaxID=1529436 RepID=UPI001425A741|nr:uncharacterized protein LOC117121976 isoform X2 [Anneissia japonica]
MEQEGDCLPVSCTEKHPTKMSGYVGDLSHKQEERLNKFKEDLKDVLGPKHDDHCLLRFLRARNFDIHKSEAFFRKDLEWRARQGIDKIQDTFKLPEVCQKYWPGGLAGYDKDGGPVWIEPTGNGDPKGLLQSCKTSDLLKYNICRMEGFTKAINEQTQKLGKSIAGVTLIMDMHGLGRHHLWKPGIDLYNQINTILQDHYPETLKVILIIRAPKIFPLAYTLCRPYLNPATRRKIHILGSDWRQVLLKYVSDDVLPVHWGGKATDPDGNPMCPSKICLGGEIPKSYYFQNVEIPEENMTVREIKRGSILEFKYNVTKPGCFFRYAFKTKDHDIAFGIKRFDSSGQKVKVLETTRVNSHYVLQDGHVELETTGYYTVKFDNSFSWTKSKRLTYMLELLEPIDDLEEEHVSTTNLNGNGVIENSQKGIKDNIENNEDETKIIANNKEKDASVEEGVKDEVIIDKEQSVDEKVKDKENGDMKESIKQEVIDEATDKSLKEEAKDESSEKKKEISVETSVKELPNLTSETKDQNEKQKMNVEASIDKTESVTEGADVETQEQGVKVVTNEAIVDKEDGFAEGDDGEDQEQGVKVVTNEAIVDKEEGTAGGADVEDQNRGGREITDVATAEKDESIADTADVEDQKQSVEVVTNEAIVEKEEGTAGAADVENQNPGGKEVIDVATAEKEESITDTADVEDQNPGGREVTDVATEEKDESIADTADVEDQKQSVKVVTNEAIVEKEEDTAGGADVENQNLGGKEVIDVATAEKEESITDTADVEDQKQGVKEVNDNASEERREMEVMTIKCKEENITEKSNKNEDMKENSTDEMDESAVKEVNNETIKDNENGVKVQERSEASDTNNETVIMV